MLNDCRIFNLSAVVSFHSFFDFCLVILPISDFSDSIMPLRCNSRNKVNTKFSQAEIQSVKSILKLIIKKNKLSLTKTAKEIVELDSSKTLIVVVSALSQEALKKKSKTMIFAASFIQTVKKSSARFFVFASIAVFVSSAILAFVFAFVLFFLNFFFDEAFQISKLKKNLFFPIYFLENFVFNQRFCFLQKNEHLIECIISCSK